MGAGAGEFAPKRYNSVKYPEPPVRIDAISHHGPFRDRLRPGRIREDDMRRDSFERFYYEKVALEGCGCAEYVSTRLRDLDGFAVKAEARGIAWSAPELRPVWLRLADRLRKLTESWSAGPRHVSSQNDITVAWRSPLLPQR